VWRALALPASLVLSAVALFVPLHERAGSTDFGNTLFQLLRHSVTGPQRVPSFLSGVFVWVSFTCCFPVFLALMIRWGSRRWVLGSLGLLAATGAVVEYFAIALSQANFSAFSTGSTSRSTIFYVLVPGFHLLAGAVAIVTALFGRWGR
jgi:hypothetical protein